MSQTEDLAVFFLLLVGIIAVPGMDMIFVLTQSLAGGRQRGLFATAGMMTGGICHAVFGAGAAFGLRHALPSVAAMMTIAGAAYMAWVGFGLVRSAIVVERVEIAHFKPPAMKVYGQALLTCLLNPKAWLFVVVVYPQFMKAAYGPIWSQILEMGAMTALVQATIYGSVAGLAGWARAMLVSRRDATVWTGRIAGGLLIAAAVYALARGLAAYSAAPT